MNAEEALALYHSVRAKHSAMLGEFASDQDLIQQTMANVVISVEDQAIDLIKPPTAYDAVTNARDHILTDPRITVPVRPTSGPQEAAVKVAEKRQQFHMMFWDNVFSQCGDPLGAGKGDLVLGKMVLKVVPKLHILPELPARPTRSDRDRYRRGLDRLARSTFLWDVYLCDKATVFEIGDSHDPKAAFECYRAIVADVRDKVGDIEALAQLTPIDEVEYLEYWEKPNGASKGKFIQWVNGVTVHEGDNPLCAESPAYTEAKPLYSGRLPYVFASSGWGNDSPTAKPEQRYVSAIKYVRSVIEAECRFLTMTHEAMKYAAFKPTKTMNVPDDMRLAVQPGSKWNLTEGQDAGFIDPGEIPASLFQGMARVNQYIDQSTKFSTLGGMPQRGVDTATEADQNIRNAATKLSAPIRNLRRLIMKVNEYAAWDVEKVFEAPVTLYGAAPSGPSEVTLTPSEINGFYTTHVELETSDEAAVNLRIARTWADLAQRLPIPFKEVMRKAGIENPAAMFDERMMENLEQSEPVMAALLQIVMQGLGNPAQAAGAPQPQTMPDMEANPGASQAQMEAIQNAPERSFQ